MGDNPVGMAKSGVLTLAVEEALRIQRLENEDAKLPRERDGVFYDPPGFCANWSNTAIQKNMSWMGLAEKVYYEQKCSIWHGGKKRPAKWFQVTITTENIRLTALGRKLLLAEVRKP